RKRCFRAPRVPARNQRPTRVGQGVGGPRRGLATTGGGTGYGPAIKTRRVRHAAGMTNSVAAIAVVHHRGVRPRLVGGLVLEAHLERRVDVVDPVVDDGRATDLHRVGRPDHVAADRGIVGARHRSEHTREREGQEQGDALHAVGSAPACRTAGHQSGDRVGSALAVRGAVGVGSAPTRPRSRLTTRIRALWGGIEAGAEPVLWSPIVPRLPLPRHACALLGAFVLCLAGCEERSLLPGDEGIDFGDGDGDPGDDDPGDGDPGDGDLGDGDGTPGDGDGDGSIACAPIVGSLVITDETPPESVVCVERVLGDLTVGPTTGLFNLQMLSSLRRVGGTAYIVGNLALTSVDGLA